MNSDFDPPPKGLSILACVGGVVTAVIAIAILQHCSNRMNQTYSQLKPEVVTQKRDKASDRKAEKKLEKEIEQKAVQTQV